jgi:hypothetical protein
MAMLIKSNVSIESWPSLHGSSHVKNGQHFIAAASYPVLKNVRWNQPFQLFTKGLPTDTPLSP